MEEKASLPGVAGAETVQHNHAMMLNANAKTGVLEGNPVHEDMSEAARMAKVDFIVNIVEKQQRPTGESFRWRFGTGIFGGSQACG